MTFVLLTAGIDLSVGSNMYLSVVVAGLLMRSSGLEIVPALLVSLLVGTLFGALNAFAIVRLKIIPFMTTLATLVIGRGLGTAFTSVAANRLPRTHERLRANDGLRGHSHADRRVRARGDCRVVHSDAHAVRAAGLRGRQRHRSGEESGHQHRPHAGDGLHHLRFCAGLAGFILASQLGGRVDRSFGETREFDAIAAAVLGGTSLFGGAGNVFGTVLGAVLIQMVGTGLQFNLVNLYLQPMVRAFIIFLAIFFDSLREANLKKMKRRFIRPLEVHRADAGD